jgi:hypothetical protein
VQEMARDKNNGQLIIECTKTINLRNTDEQFLVTVDSLSIDKDNDDLTINGEMLKNSYNTIFTSADKKIQYNNPKRGSVIIRYIQRMCRYTLINLAYFKISMLQFFVLQ